MILNDFEIFTNEEVLTFKIDKFEKYPKYPKFF
jgi:hypothetical protein